MEKEFLKQMQDVLDCDIQLNMDTDLLDVEEWDSLSFIKFLGMANSVYGKKIRPSAVRNAVTVKDLFNMIK